MNEGTLSKKAFDEIYSQTLQILGLLNTQNIQFLTKLESLYTGKAHITI